MSDFYADMRGLSKDLFNEFGRFANITNTTKAYDKRLDKVTDTVEQRPCLAVLSTDKIVAENGSIVSVRMVTTNRPINAGDKLIMAGKSYLIGNVEVISPDGGEAISYKGVIK